MGAIAASIFACLAAVFGIFYSVYQDKKELKEQK